MEAGVPSLRSVMAWMVEKLVIINEREREGACRVKVKGEPGTEARGGCWHLEV